MKITEIKIAPRQSWSRVGKDNPMVATVKLESDGAIVEVKLSDEDMQRMLDLVRGTVAEAAERNIAEFVSAVRAMPSEAQPSGRFMK